VKIELFTKVFILAKTGIQLFDESRKPLDSRLRGNDGHWTLTGFARSFYCYYLFFAIISRLLVNSVENGIVS